MVRQDLKRTHTCIQLLAWGYTRGFVWPPAHTCVRHPSKKDERTLAQSLAVRNDMQSDSESESCSTVTAGGAAKCCRSFVRYWWRGGVVEHGVGWRGVAWWHGGMAWFNGVVA